MKNLSPNVWLLLASLFFENLATQLCFIYLPIAYLILGQQTIAFFTSSLQFVGPFVIGGIAGVAIDAFGKKRLLWRLPLAIFLLAALLFMSVQAKAIFFIMLCLIGLSIAQYMSTNARISLSKYLVPQDEVSGYHRWVITAIESAGLAAPLLVTIFLSLRSGATVGIFVIMLVALSLSTVQLWQATRQVEDRPNGSLALQSLLARLITEFKVVIKDKPLLYSSLSASFSNFLLASVSLLSIQKIMSLGTQFSSMSPIILAVLGLGSITGSVLQGKLDKYKRNYIQLLQLTFVGLLLLSIVIGFTHSIVVVFACLFGLGILASTISVVTWGIRFERSQANNMGSVAGITGAIYKALPLFGLPVLGPLIVNSSLPTVMVGVGLLMLIPIAMLYTLAFVQPIPKQTSAEDGGS
ncbi:MAG: MFS transporter [Trueperaceae bacterium]